MVPMAWFSDSIWGMKRSTRAMLNGVTVFSGVMALLVAPSWVWSYWGADMMSYTSHDNRTIRWLGVSKARISCGINRADQPMAEWKSGRRFGWFHGRAFEDSRTCLFPGLGWTQTQGILGWRAANTEVMIAHVGLLIVFALLPLIRVYR